MSADAESVFRENLSLFLKMAEGYGALSREYEALEDAFLAWRERYLSISAKVNDFSFRFHEGVMSFIARKVEREGYALDEYLDEPGDTAFVELAKEARDDFLRVPDNNHEFKVMSLDLSAMLDETIRPVLERCPAGTQAISRIYSVDLAANRFLIPEIETQESNDSFGFFITALLQRENAGDVTEHHG
ncbi:MAG: hypothetical protein Q8Q94_03070 [bacterium]|nr:hypothetical protein [bacterium]MDZ4299394.1 hypothetical protein [Candidatus Sungbacteria bacterium]